MSKTKKVKKARKLSEQKNEFKNVNNRRKRFLNWFFTYLTTILYVFILAILWTYIIFNWEKCISMQFFSEFDGNNILFLVGILLTVLPFYEIEGKGFKLHRINLKNMGEELKGAESKYKEKSIEIQMDKLRLQAEGKALGGEDK